MSALSDGYRIRIKRIRARVEALPDPDPALTPLLGQVGGMLDEAEGALPNQIPEIRQEIARLLSSLEELLGIISGQESTET